MASSEDIADRLEFRVWADNASQTASSVQQDIQSLIPSADSQEAADITTGVFEIIVQRKLILGAKYPFAASRTRISPLPPSDEGTVYLFCLALSVVSHGRIAPRVRDLIFEQLAKSAAEGYFGGIGIQTGAKWRQHGHASFGDLVKKVGSLIAELGHPVILTQPGGGDHGWDVILVKPFGDGLYPRLIVGGNCATGKTDWEQKGAEVVFPSWFRHFFNRQPDGPYLEFFAFPFVATDDQRSRKTGKETFLFDRFRLAEFGKKQVGMDEWLARKAGPEAKQLALI